jgi:predicted PurR-regulated permease PerM
MQRNETEEIAFLRRVLIVGGVVVLGLVIWRVRDAFLLAFGGVVAAVVLLAVSRPLEARFGLSRKWSLTAVGLALGVVLALIVCLVGGQVRAQVTGLAGQLSGAVELLQQQLGMQLPTLPGPDGDGERGSLDSSVLADMLGRVATIGGVVVNTTAALVVALVGGFFLAADPALYRRGATKLLPRSQQARADDALTASGQALRLWLIAQFISMVIVGVLVGLGTWALGLPSPLALGLFAGLVEFVPLIGPVIGSVPALLLAMTEGSATFLWTAVLFLAIQQVESNLIAPLLEQRLVSLPPALLLFAVVAVGLLFGLPGVVLAAPITVVAFVLVKKLYVRQTLGERTEVPGES